MKIAQRILMAIGLAALAMTPAVARQESPTAGRSIKTLARVPLHTRGGEAITFGSRVVPGKVTLVSFWSSWCVPCMAEAPTLNRLRRELGDRFTFIYVNRREGDPDPNQPAGDIARFLRRGGMADIDYVVADIAASRRLLGGDVNSVPPGKVGIPRVYLFDRKGRQIYAHYGFDAASGAELEQRVREAVAGR